MADAHALQAINASSYIEARARSRPIASEFNVPEAFSLLVAMLVLPMYLAFSVLAFSLGALY